MTRFQCTIRCTDCGHRYKRTLAAVDEDALAMLPNPPCPICTKVAERRVFDFESRKAPAAGGSLVVKAVDTTAEIVMQDYGQSDLRSDVREGESAAPKLPPRLQAQADAMFSRRRPGANAGIMGLPTRAVMQAAVSGRFNTPDTVNPVAVQHATHSRAPIHIVAGDGVRKT